MADVQATNDALISAERVSKVFPLPEGHGTFNVLVEWLRHARLSLSLQPSYEFGGLTDVAQAPLSSPYPRRLISPGKASGLQLRV